MEISRSEYIPPLQENSVNSCDEVRISEQSDVDYWINIKSLPCYKYIETRYHRYGCFSGEGGYEQDPYEVQIICANQLHWKINKNRENRLESIDNTHKIDDLLATENRLRIQNEKDEKIKEKKEKKEKYEYQKLVKKTYEESYKLVNIPITQTEISAKYKEYYNLIKRTKKLQTYIRETQKQLKEINYQRSDLIFRIKELKKSEYLKDNNTRITDHELNDYKSNKSNCVVCKISIIQQNLKSEKYRNPKDFLTHYFLYLINYELCFECFNYRYYIYCFLCNEFTDDGRGKNDDYRICNKCKKISMPFEFLGSKQEKYWKPGAATSDDKSEALSNYELRLRYGRKRRF